MDLVNLSVPVIVGGIAGMTLSITGVKQIHDLCDGILRDVAHLDPRSYSTLISYSGILYRTIFLIGGFFLSEIVIGVAMYIYPSDNTMATTIVVWGYGVLIATLLAMLILYSSMIYYTQRIVNPRSSGFESDRGYPGTLPPPIAPP